uniref:Uncharacterized protein n=1 Tax=Cannabis sativa TaxID=3483 RepID=A0A803NHX5_CANSA
MGSGSGRVLHRGSSSGSWVFIVDGLSSVDWAILLFSVFFGCGSLLCWGGPMMESLDWCQGGYGGVSVVRH